MPSGNVALIIALALSLCGCSQGTGDNQPLPIAEQTDPFGFGTIIAATPSKDLERLVVDCQLSSKQSAQKQAFDKPCFVRTEAKMSIKFDQYETDEKGRIIAISGMMADPETAQKCVHC